MPIKHKFHSMRVDSDDQGAVGSSEWNDDHEVDGELTVPSQMNIGDEIIFKDILGGTGTEHFRFGTTYGLWIDVKCKNPASDYTIFRVMAPDKETANESTIYLGRDKYGSPEDSEGVDISCMGTIGDDLRGEFAIVLQRRGIGVKRDFKISHYDGVTEDVIFKLKTNGDIELAPDTGLHWGSTSLHHNPSVGVEVKIADMTPIQVGYDRIKANVRMNLSGSTPASATAAGTAGDICWDANYVYVCVATNTWKRSPLTSW
jgi:hypothetical protein